MTSSTRHNPEAAGQYPLELGLPTQAPSVIYDAEGMQLDMQPGIAVNIKERARHLGHVLDMFGAINSRTGMQHAWETPHRHGLERRYGADLPQVMQGVEDKKAWLGREAQWQFDYATGYMALSGSDVLLEAEPEEAKRTQDRGDAFLAFRERYGKVGQSAERKAYKRVLQGSPLRKRPKQESVVFENNEGLLTTQNKLVALHGDERARLTPATNREKTTALTLLDYIGATDHPGVYDYLQEIYEHQRKGARKAGQSYHKSQQAGQDAVRSVLYEFGDYLKNARQSYANLTALAQLVDDCSNPRLSVKELLEAHGPGAPDAGAFVRHLDITGLRTGKQSPTFDVLLTQENRFLATTDKNKTVEDRYTATVRPLAMDEYIEKRLATMRVGGIREAVQSAVREQQQRAVFWRNILTSVPYTYRRRAEQVLASVA